VINDVVLLASELTLLFSRQHSFQTVITNISNSERPLTSPAFFKQGQSGITSAIFYSYRQLARLLKRLSLLLEPMTMLVKKGEYLSVCSSVEAANSGQYSASFNAVAEMLREQVDLLNAQSMTQRGLLRDLIEVMDKQLDNLRDSVNES
jgi:hypothetical protein